MSELSKIDLHKAGLKITLPELYNPGGVSTVDAIVRVGGCTGSFISPDGLIITNHHCAFSFVQGISSTKNNYIRDGYYAPSRPEEAPAKGLVCKITESYEDVSSRVLEGTQSINDPVERMKVIGANIKSITEAANRDAKNLQCEISEMFTGRTYVLFRYKLLKDVRLVYVPARSVGEYGGEKDNWVWPRHSGDFAILRAYVAPDGSSSDFSISNVPYKPVKYLKINPHGVRENDFVFILGYPGRTFRHQQAAFYRYHQQYMLTYISNLYDWQINWMEERSRGNDSLTIRYSSRMKSLANVTKNYKGKLQGFRRTGIIEKKEQEEQQLQAFVDSDPTLKAQYGTVIPRVNKLYEEVIKFAPRNLWYDMIYNVAPMLATAAAIDNFGQAYRQLKTKQEKAEFREKQLPRLQGAYYALAAKYDVAFEKDAVMKMLHDAAAFNADNNISGNNFITRGGMDENAWRKKVDAMYAKTIFRDVNKVDALIKGDWDKLFGQKDPLIQYASVLNREINLHDEEDRRRDGELNLLAAKFVDMKSAWKQSRFIPDANATLRFTYGYVKGYSPNDAEWDKPFTTLTGVIEKEDGKEYELLQVIKDLYAAKDYGSLIHPDLHDLPVNFLYDLDTTGGNSGSPVMDANGDLVGVNFDRAFSATINDYAWNESYSRSVGVDIRYVLWILKKVAGAQRVIDEIGVKV